MSLENTLLVVKNIHQDRNKDRGPQEEIPK